MYPLKSFTPLQKKKDYKLSTFMEDGQQFAILSDKNLEKPKSGNKYKFGCIIGKSFHWFFLGKVVCRDREKAIKIYNALLIYCNENKIGTPFCLKA